MKTHTDPDVMYAARREGLNAWESARANSMTELAALQEAIHAAVRCVAHDLGAMLYPELYPGYDQNHVYWSDIDDLKVTQRWGVSGNSQGTFYAIRGNEQIGPLTCDAAIERARWENIRAAGKAGELPKFEWDAQVIDRVGTWVQQLLSDSRRRCHE